jgi:putative intracellular protease/amidase
VDLLVIPGGRPSDIISDPEMKDKVDIFLEKVRRIDRNGGKLAAICGGPEWLATAGILDGRRCTHSQDQPSKAFDKAIFTNEHLTVDGNIITAQGQAYAEFAVEMGRQMGVYKSDEEAKADLDWLRDRSSSHHLA